MFGPFDIILIASGLVLCGISLVAGIAFSVVAIIAFAIAMGGALMIGTPLALFLAMAFWAAGVLVAGMVLRRFRRRAPANGSRVGGTVVMVALVVAASVFATGAWNTRTSDSVLIRSSASYPFIALAGEAVSRFDVVEAAMTFPAPVVPKPAISPAPPAPPRPIDWAEVQPFDNQITRIIAGNVVAADRAPISFGATGTILRVFVDIGDRFERGDILAELDPTALQIALEERQAGLMEARARAQEAQTTLGRQMQLFGSDVVSQAALDSATAMADSAQGRLEMARAGVRQAEDRLADAVLLAPYDGIIAARLIEPAQSVQAGAPAFEIQSADAGFQIEISMPDTLITQIEQGSEHHALILDGSDTEVSVRVHEIGSRANAATGFPVMLDILEPDALIRAGMTAEISLNLRLDAHDLRDRPLLAIPYTAILPAEDEGHVAFVFDYTSNTLERRAILVAAREGSTVLVSHGMEDGDVVATRGLAFLEDGQRVTLRGVGIARYDN
ncbi:efflux RND transporter periplasmic adaptor subunit [Jannaschia sp. CCS1]|uniref:efflux RND transporter periplasmic adaptor subunit n=1 Tax=Jannaschia sp. (strain CCS1) TaxID=290400 RepID=UPI000053D291|nr:efflux RND transporter periplasmic adaptor subunit [Jannaschia sp. CCS1]ABD54233.1 secretion protein HlyD [Jannaschia sp. CCS1]